jgi:hypothetical protein
MSNGKWQMDCFVSSATPLHTKFEGVFERMICNVVKESFDEVHIIVVSFSDVQCIQFKCVMRLVHEIRIKLYFLYLFLCHLF